jgi:hypothetical protein
LVTQERLKELLYYHPESGDFVWLVQPSQGTKAGTQAGCFRRDGYICITIGRKRLAAHRLAVLYMTGFWPTEEVDHGDGVKHHNWWGNLREATHSQNQFNRGAYSNSSSKIKNVRWYPNYGKYVVDVRANKKQYHVGYFDTVEEAIAARDVKTAELHGDFARAA